MSIAGKVVVITGTTAGIGRTLAEVFAARGAKVVGCGRNETRGAKVAAAIAAAGGTFTFHPADVTRREDCYQVIDAAVAEHGRVDVLINNAGGSTDYYATAEVDEEVFDGVVRLNLHGPLFCSQRAIQHMRPAGGGVILSIASVQGVQAVAMQAAYNAAKAALIQLSNTIAVEYQKDSVRSNVIVMGGAPTAAAAGAMRDATRMLKGPDANPDFTRYMPLPVTGTPLKDIADAMAALASDDCRAITGATIAIDQGQSAGALYSDAMFLALAGDWTPPIVPV